MDLVMEFDDFSPRNTNFGLLEDIREHYPNFKVTLFTVPWEIRFGTQTLITDAPELGHALRESSDWIEIAIHGLTHAPEEFLNLSYDDAKKRILVSEKMLLNQKIPYTKVFKAPFWQLSKEAKRAAEDLGFRVVEDHYYDWNLKDDKPGRLKVDMKPWHVAHGHIQITSGNGLEEVMHRILDLPTDTKFHFLSEYLDTEKIFPDQLDFRDPLEQIKIFKHGKEWI